MIKRFFFIAVLFLVSVVLSACIPTLSTGPSAQKGGEFVKGGIAPGFSGDVPLYKEVQVIETYASESSFGGSFVVEDDLLKVVRYYQDVLPSLGWESRLQEQQQNYWVFKISNELYRGEIIVNAAGDGRAGAITIAVSAR